MQDNIIDEISRIKDVLPKKQQKLCNYLLMNYEQVSVMTVAELAAAAGVGTTTVLRLVQTLGLTGYSALKKSLLDSALMRTATSYHGIKQAITDYDSNTNSSSSIQDVTSDSIFVLENLCTPSNMAQFHKAAEMLSTAKNIFTLGLRSSRAIALYFEYCARVFHPHITQLSHDPDYLYDRAALEITGEDVLLIISVWPCTQLTVNVAKECSARKIPMILVTNTNLNPIARFADVIIDTNSVNHVSGDTVIFAVIEALTAELGRRTAPDSTRNVEKIEEIISQKKMVLTADT